MSDASVTGAEEHAADEQEILRFWELARKNSGVGVLSVYLGTDALAVVPPAAWAFGDEPEAADAAVDAVLAGERTAVSTPLAALEGVDERAPEVDDLSIVLDGKGNPRALIRTTEVRSVHFSQVDEEHARREGESSVDAWREAQQDQLRAAGAPGESPDADPVMVLERFEVLYP
ncbi:ASCH domain-containing protein [Cellulomonas bogoriensis]|uniref:ASCH domain-containing protein n=1 Tax=Cellulomonas bogoriensis 69B4 = DSM 16987 TaxID=1386082 RepID=A0A0A0C182_9CELL|nr:ASCH domain-containing protein [Cellulomonas bogoriensis]KGM14398.1 hypothetical protein N869_12585 [Cellulomonas bogoriensis 69B4 = DSM 16987]